jgi:phosphohistidine phosphatase SixA
MRKIVLSISSALLFSLLAPASGTTGLDVWEKLSERNPKGHVLLIRHAYAPGSGDPANFKLGDCSTQRNLSSEGRAEARSLGEWIKSRNVMILRIESSRWCRANETAELLNLGEVKPNKNLDSLFTATDKQTRIKTAAIKKQIIRHRQDRGLVIMVGHFVNFSALTGIGLDSGQGVLVKANSKGQIKVVGYSPVPD